MQKKDATEKKFCNPLNIVLILVFVGISAYVYIGFFYPDTTSFVLDGTKSLQNKIWLFFPIVIITFIALYRVVYLKLLKLGSVILLFIILVFLILLKFQISEYLNIKASNERIKNFHSYLQLTPSKTILNSNSSLNIFCLGGSTTENKDKLGRDWESLVENELSKDFQFKDVHIYNCGRHWYTTQHILINYIQNLKDLNPDVIVIMENINDLLHNADFSTFSNGEFREDYGHFLGPFRNIIKYNSYLDFILNSFKKLWYQKESILVETDQFPGLVSYERNLHVLIQLAKADGILVILMTQPNLYKEKMSEEELNALTMLNYEAIGNGKRWSYKTAYIGINAYNDKMKQIALKENVCLIDLEKNVPKSLEYFQDDVHYQSKAYDLISNYLTPEIKRILIEHNLPISSLISK